ncbi:non-ribosomal peptide synthase domain TIGR01720/amino acid adenylation domain-containing protein [Streptomyces radiopugnans]|uniref:Non-ribosomal peptide synthase domain TIGR01720/amino acid adenylation domain-containing protein n=1 Tax=Streptomyces radiopugnans TaxID=403935 RepID=A0A1H9JGB1_9ACTN|nr:non-ribosomal peptide synthetase [Streptomyces radiopugnans]SEQ85819.1 non-ribosomal peptide synthase domain TIGR01720/amino acid adenylation domain-containing protein [Streptomyces radiopugnans]
MSTKHNSSLEAVLPLTPLQEGLLFHAQYDGQAGPDVYVMQLGMDIDGPLDVPALHAAARALLERHGNLRAGFRHEGARPLQFIPKSVELPWREVDLADLPEEERDAALREVTERDRAARFDLRRPPLLRFTVVRTAQDRHRLLVTNHHILLDGWSAPILVRELFELYATGGDAAALPAVTPYRYHLAWLAKQDRAAAAEAWRGALDGLDGPTMLAAMPDDRSTSVLPSKVSGRLSPETTARLTQRVRELGLTLNTVVQAAWGLLLGRLTDRTDVTFGMTLAGRPPEIPGVHTMVGLFLNTVPVRVRVRPDESLSALCRRIQDEQQRLMAHQHLGLAEIQQAAGHGDLFDTLTVLENFPVDPAALELPGGLSVDGVFSTDGAHYPLALMVMPGPSLELRFTYRCDAFDAAEVETFSNRLVAVLESFVSAPETPAGGVEVLDAAERSRLLGEWNPAPPPAAARTLPELLALRTAEAPQRQALVCGDQSLTYAELSERVEQIAAWLRDRGVRPEQPVGIAMGRSVEYVLAVLGVVRAGAVYAPIDHRWPRARREDILASSGIEFVLEPGDLPARHPVPEGGVPMPPGPERIACLMHTSGSTGRPKGVAVTHRGIGDLVADSRFAGGAHERVLLHSAHAFDASTYEMWTPLLNGGTLVIGPPGELDVATIGRTLAEGRVTAAVFTTGLFRLIAAEAPETFRPLREVWVGGEAVPAASVRQVLKACPDTTVVDVYGPAEATVMATACPLPAGEPVPDPVPIGRPFDGKQVYVLDGGLRLCPVGVAGELYVAGVGLARGYLGRPDLTAQRFVANPFGAPGERLYRTGDVVRWRADGQLEFVGRRDNQVKLRGFRIELGEIESVLADHDAVGQVAVVVREDRPGVRQLVGYAVPAAGARLVTEELRAWAAERLPEYMVPRPVIALDALPLTTNGKLDVRALPAPEYTAEDTRGPRTPHEELLCGLFAEVLGLPAVSVHDNFFELGGHSLLATRLVSRVRAVLGVELPIRKVFEEPTVAALAARLTDSPAAVRTALRPADRPERVPLSFAQRRLWFLNRMEGPSATYNIPFAVRLTGALDVAALTAAFNDVVGRHEALRTVFPDADGEPWQQIVPVEEATVAIEVSDVPEAGLDAALDAAGSAGFDLATDLPVRAWLFRITDDEHVLCVVVHHIAGDGWSQAPLARDLGEAYRARLAGAAPTWQPLPVQYADYTLWQQQLLGDERDEDSPAAAQLAYWSEQLAGSPQEIELPADRPRPPVATHRGGSVPVRIDAELHEDLRTLAAKTDTTPFMVFQAALAALLSRLGAGEDIPIGTPVAGRTDAAADDLIGFFVNTLVLRTDVSGDPGFIDLLRRVRATALGAYAHQDLPFERLVDLVGADRSLSHNPLFQVLLAYQNNDIRDIELPGLRVTAQEVLLPVAKVDLELSLAEDAGAGGISGILNYSTDLFDRESAERIAAHLVTLLRAAAADPTRPVRRLEILSPEQREQLLTGWNDTDRPVSAGTVPALFAERAAAFADRPAVVSDRVTVDYATLADRANRLARLLIERGVGPEDRVALVLPRSIGLTTALLAVMTAGAAYVPVDPNHPADRIDYMVRDSDPALVVTVSELTGRLPRQVADPLVLDSPALVDALAGLSGAEVTDAERRVPLSADHPAYVIYTSGSTGRPKGVVVPHRGLGSLAAWQARWLGVGAGSRVGQFAAPSFDAAAWETVMALLNGAALVLTPADGPVLGEALTDFLRTKGITHATLTPTALSGAEPQAAPPGLTLVTAGEACPRDLAARWSPGRRVINAYGPTETTVCATASGPVDGTVTPPIGGPIANTRVYVLDAGMNPCPVGVPGELYVAGVGLARGYLGRPGLTAERFVADPFGAPGSRLYRTGDVVRRLADGQLEFVGRRDNQVKLRGFRIELGEIESVLSGCAGVDGAAVVVREDRPGVRQLVGYLVPDGEAGCEVGAVRARAAERLPEYMVPQAFVVVDALPLTVNGKLDHAALPAPELTTGGAGQGPATDAEEILAEAFREVLGLPEVGVEDNFFELGGDSIVSIKLVGQARKGGLVITPRDVFEHKSVAALAAVARTVDELPPEDPDAGIGEVPLTPMTHWLRELGGRMERFHQSVLLRVPAQVDAESLTAAVRAVLDHHDALRLRLTVTGGQWSYEVRPRGAVNAADCVTRVDVAGADREKTRAAIAMHAEQAVSRLSPTDGAMLQVVWFDAGPQEPGRLLVAGHHLAVDGVSWRILVPDLAAAWQAAAESRKAALQPVGTSWRSWAQWLTELAAQPARAAQVAWWADQLRDEDVPVTAQPRDPAVDTMGTQDALALTLTEQVTERLLTAVPTAARCGVEDVLLTAFALAVSDWRRRSGLGAGTAVLVDVERHGRQIPEGVDLDISRTVGWFTSLAPVRLDLGPVSWGRVFTDSAALHKALTRVKETLREMPDEGIGFGLLRHLNPRTREELAGFDPPQFGFNYLGRAAVAGDTDTDDWSMSADGDVLRELGGDPDMPASHSVSLNVLVEDTPNGPRLVANWTWPRRLLDPGDVRRLADGWFRALTALAEHAGEQRPADLTPSDLSLIDLELDDIGVLEAEWRKTQ